MTEKSFTFGKFKEIIKKLMTASEKHDGLALQNLEVEIINTYQATTMNSQEYRVLIDMCDIMLDDWRRNNK